MEQVDILLPPTFKKTGIIKPRDKALANGDWIGTFNLWIIQSDPIPSIIYQQRSSNSTWAPNKLDVTAGGHYKAGETIFDGLREVKEELGRTYDKNKLTYLGKKIHISSNTKGHSVHNIVDIFFVTDNSPISSYKLEENEVYAVMSCPIEKLIKVHSEGKEFQTTGITNKGENIEVTVTKNSFPYNWDNYHFKIALLAQRYLEGEKNLLY